MTDDDLKRIARRLASEAFGLTPEIVTPYCGQWYAGGDDWRGNESAGDYLAARTALEADGKAVEILREEFGLYEAARIGANKCEIEVLQSFVATT
jgi:hypothetical protein